MAVLSIHPSHHPSIQILHPGRRRWWNGRRTTTHGGGSSLSTQVLILLLLLLHKENIKRPSVRVQLVLHNILSSSYIFCFFYMFSFSMVVFKIGNTFCHKMLTITCIKIIKFTRFLNQDKNKGRLSSKSKLWNKNNINKNTTRANQESNKVLLQGKRTK